MFEISILLMIFTTGMLLIVAMLKRQSAAIHMPSVNSENCVSDVLNTVAETELHVERVKKPPPKNASDQFIQTMSATFAHLQIGIAVFDKNNELSLFNPALSKHLGLRPEWMLKNRIYPDFLTGFAIRIFYPSLKIIHPGEKYS